MIIGLTMGILGLVSSLLASHLIITTPMDHPDPIFERWSQFTNESGELVTGRSKDPSKKAIRIMRGSLGVIISFIGLILCFAYMNYLGML